MDQGSGRKGDPLDAKKSEALEGYISSLTEMIRDFDIELPAFNLEKPQDSIELYDKIGDSKTKQREYDELAKRTPPANLEKTRKKLEALKEKIASESKSDLENEELEEDVAPYLEKLEVERREKSLAYDTLARDRDLLIAKQKEQKSKEVQVEKLRGRLSSEDIQRSITKLEKELSSLTRELLDLTSSIKEKRDLHDTLTKYEHSLELFDELSTLEDDLLYCNEEIDSLTDLLVGLKELEETGKEAEIIALERTIKSINAHAQIYLDQMFDKPISVELKCLTDTKTQGLKLKMCTLVEYEGVVYDDFAEFSGGESHRAELAFLLGVNDMLGGKIIMLDECPSD